MCTTKVFVHVHQDGHRSTNSQVLLCPASRHNRPCADHTVVQQPASRDQLPHAPAAPIIAFPPTPDYSPRRSNYSPRPSNYSPRPSSRGSAAAAVSDADRHSSRHSSRQSSTSSSRRSPGIYVNGQRMVNVYGSSRPERIMLVPHPPTPRTPPQTNSMPRTAPSSPSANPSIPYSSSPRQHYNQPYLVDERQRGMHHAAVQPASPGSNSSRHSRQTSAGSQGSRRSFSSAADDEERRRRRDERGERRSSRKTDELRDRIKHANDEIANRPAVRTVDEQQQQQPPVTERRSRRDGHEELVGIMSRLNVEDKNWRQRRAYEKAAVLEQEEIEAQNQRMRERTVPQRRATVGPGSRRHRIAYDDGLYRWE
ncbi:hypothetical protein MY11210_004300 [Beauveria gryllotalpidicola]